MREVADMEDLLISILVDLKIIAKEKGGLGQLIIEKRAKIDKLSARRFFTKALVA